MADFKFKFANENREVMVSAETDDWCGDSTETLIKMVSAIEDAFAVCNKLAIVAMTEEELEEEDEEE